ncbi:succinate dehydrogenase, hydrophobic membrane anchor protein [Hyphomonas sp.]|uniref:succinate dehydrogenase, hydrophobic membrane anchor protein n=1 Tax=Hyphomonas sp. TaxID=87 RepID=UPI00391D4295
MSNGEFITPTKAARGLGSAKSGTAHHIRQRVSALALIVLVPWFLYAVIKAASGGYDGARAWVSDPLNALLLVLTAAAAFYHMRLGMQVVIEDYIGKAGTRGALMILNTFATAILFAAVFLSVIRVWTGA